MLSIFTFYSWRICYAYFSNELKDTYVFKDFTVGFSQGRRINLRYASESRHTCYTRVNLDGPQPYEYLNYAKNDVSLGNVQGAINGISNAKRAIHQTIDALFYVWGLEFAFKRASFPAKLEIMHSLKAFPIRLNYLNQERNLIEHEYKTIDINKAIDFIDISEMFLMLAHPYLKHATISAFVGLDKEDHCFEWQIDFQSKKILVLKIDKCPFFDSSIGPIHYNFPSEDKDKEIIQTIKIEKSNQGNWLSYLDLFVYLTKRSANHLQDSANKDSWLIMKKEHRFLFPKSFTGLDA